MLAQHTSAVEHGDLDAIGKLWSNDELVTVIENGHANYGWANYRDNHLGPELREMKNVRYALSGIKVNTSGHLAWATFKYTIAADFRERHIEGGGMGTAVLQHGPNGWQIMHWHSRARGGWLRPALRKELNRNYAAPLSQQVQANSLLRDR